MQNLERIPGAVTGRSDVEPAHEKNQGLAAADDFGRMMQRALTSKAKESPREIALRAERKPAASATTCVQPENNPTDSSPKKIPRAVLDKSAVPTSPEPASLAAAGPMWPLRDLIDPLPPVQLPVPPSVCFGSPQIAADFSAPSKIEPALTAMPMNEVQAGASAPATNPKTMIVAGEENASLAAELAPSKDMGPAPAPKSEPAKIETASAPAAVLNNLVVAETAKPAASAEPKLNELAAASVHAPEIGGTGVATGEVPMKKNANTNKVAGLDGTVLPGDAARPARETVLPPPALPGPVRAADTNTGETNINLTLPETCSSVDFSAAQTLAILPSLTDARMRNLERTHDMVALHAVRLLEAQTDTLSVVIKPGAGTELSLELRQRNGSVEAHAVLSRGDFQLMNQHWPELQQRLEQRGIKLAPLGGEAGFSTDSGGSFKQQQPSSRELEAQKASAFAEFVLAGRTLGATARLAVGGWESWA